MMLQVTIGIIVNSIQLVRGLSSTESGSSTLTSNLRKVISACKSAPRFHSSWGSPLGGWLGLLLGLQLGCKEALQLDKYNFLYGLYWWSLSCRGLWLLFSYTLALGKRVVQNLGFILLIIRFYSTLSSNIVMFKEIALFCIYFKGTSLHLVSIE